jgi:hypothetical protein
MPETHAPSTWSLKYELRMLCITTNPPADD